MALMKKLDKENDISEEVLEELRKVQLDFVNNELKVIKYKNPDGTIQELVCGPPGSFTMLDKVTLIKKIKEATNVGGLLIAPLILAAMRAPGMCRIIMPTKENKDILK